MFAILSEAYIERMRELFRARGRVIPGELLSGNGPLFPARKLYFPDMPEIHLDTPYDSIGKLAILRSDPGTWDINTPSEV